MKVTGAVFKEWYDNHFPEGFYLEVDGLETHDDQENWIIADDELVNPDDFGVLMWHGDGFGDQRPDPTGGDGLSISSCIRKWRKQATTSVFAVTVPKGKEDDLKTAVKAIGGSVK